MHPNVANINDLVESVNKQSQKDLELQHEKCKLDKQNFETKNNKYQIIIEILKRMRKIFIRFLQY